MKKMFYLNKSIINSDKKMHTTPILKRFVRRLNKLNRRLMKKLFNKKKHKGRLNTVKNPAPMLLNIFIFV